MADSLAAGPADGTAERPITVVIADDQRMVRRGFRVILEAEPDIAVVAEAGDGREAVEFVRRTAPTVALLGFASLEHDSQAEETKPRESKAAKSRS